MRKHAVRLLVALASGVAAATCHAASEQINEQMTPGPTAVVDFARQLEFREPQYSPDGKYIAALIIASDNPRENAFAIFDGTTSKALRVIRAGRDAMIHKYFWFDDHRLIASLAVRQGSLDRPAATGEIFAMDVDGKNGTDLFGIRAGKKAADARVGDNSYLFADVITPYAVDGENILIATHIVGPVAFEGSPTTISKLDVATGYRTPIGDAYLNNATVIADHHGRARVSFDDYRLAIREDNPHAKFSARVHPIGFKEDYDNPFVDGGNAHPWKILNDPAKSRLRIRPIGFNRDNDKLYVEVSHEGAPDSIDLMDLKTGSRRLLYQGKYANPGQLLATADQQDYYAVITNDGKKSIYFFETESEEARLTQALAASFPGELAYFSSFTRDGKRAIVTVQSDRDPGRYYIFDLATHQAHTFMRSASWIDPDQMHAMEPIELKARDGLALHGYITLPAGPKPYPLVVLPHGGPSQVFDQWEFDPEVQMLAAHGYAVLQVNYRGSDGYGAWFQQLSIRQWGLKMQDDLTDATHWAIDQGYTTPHRICIYGASYGGYAALEGAVREPDLYNCAIGYSGTYDLRVQEDESDAKDKRRTEQALETILGTDHKDLLARSPLGGVDKIKANVLLIHGKEDRRTPYENFKEMTSALDKAGKHYDKLVMSHEGHGFFDPDHLRAAYQKILDFLAKNIGHSPAATASNASP